MSRWHPFNRSQYLELKTLMPGYLLNAQGDRMLMANSVEGRFPFLDHRVIEFAARLRPSIKMRALNEKYLLKRAMAGLVPASIIERHKQPYRAPDIPAFFSGKPPDYVTELLSAAKVREEAEEVGRAVLEESDQRVDEEAADLLFHLTALLHSRGHTLADAQRVLLQRRR